MSEFSASYHIRVDRARDLQKLLRNEKYAGILSGPQNGWLAFVPYADSPLYKRGGGASFADRLSSLTRCAVLHYFYAEDHGWGFALARPDCPVMQHECWWNPESTVEQKHFDLAALEPLVASEQLGPLLGLFDHDGAMQVQPAYRFAQLLGLPIYKWLSPELVQQDTGEFLKLGARKLGTKPAGLAARLALPPSRRIAVPNQHLSAREALDLIVPFMTGFKSPWDFGLLASYGPITSDGRGGWQARWCHRDSGDTVSVSLREGWLSFQAYTSRLSMSFLPKPIVLTDGWLDSSDVANIAACLPIPNECFNSHMSLMCLRSFEYLSLAWELYFRSENPAQAAYASWSIYIDAISGDVVLEQLGRLRGHEIVPARQRVKGADWKDVEG